MSFREEGNLNSHISRFFFLNVLFLTPWITWNKCQKRIFKWFYHERSI